MPEQPDEHVPGVSDVVPLGDRRASLVAIRNRLAREMDEATWKKHKRDCDCFCGLGDPRALVALAKSISEVMAELDAMPGSEERTRTDDVVAAVSSLDAHRRQRPKGSAATAG